MDITHFENEIKIHPDYIYVLDKYIDIQTDPKNIEILLSSIFGDVWRRYGNNLETLFISIMICEIVIDDEWRTCEHIMKVMKETFELNIHHTWEKYFVSETFDFLLDHSITRYCIDKDDKGKVFPTWWTHEAEMFYRSFLVN